MPLHWPWPWWRCLLTALSALALVLSAYLGWHYLSGGSVVGCAAGQACDQVLGSRWSTIGGMVPISGLAAGVYLAMLLATFFIGKAALSDRRLAWGALLILAGAAAGSGVWFTIIQEWLVGAFCLYCMATHITALLLAALVIWQASRQRAAAPAGPLLSRLSTVGLPIAGVALAALLAASQLAFAPPSAYRGGKSQNALPAIEPRAVPLVGSPDAPYVVTVLFDYNCPHCQKLHAMLEDAIRRYDGKLAFALCPAPLNSRCNPYIPRDVDEFKDSCELARIALAVWVAKPEAFADFDRWMFYSDSQGIWRPRTLDATRAKAAEVLGQAKFDGAQADPWIERYLQASVRIYGNTVNPDQSGNAVPKLVFGTRWVTPEPQSAEDLVSILQETVALPKP